MKYQTPVIPATGVRLIRFRGVAKVATWSYRFRWGKMPRLRGSDAWQHEKIVIWGKMPRLRGSERHIYDEMPRLRGSDAWQHELTHIVIRWGKMPRLRGSDAWQHELTHIVIRWGKMPRLRGADALQHELTQSLSDGARCPGYGGLMRGNMS